MRNLIKANLSGFIIGIVGTLFGLYVYFIAIPSTIRMPTREVFFYQRPDILPKLLAVSIIIISIIIFISTFSPKNIRADQYIIDKNKFYEVILPVSLLMCSFVAYPIVFPLLGYRLTSIIFLACLFLIFGYRNIFLLFTISIAVPIGLALFFARFLRVFLP